MNFITELEVQIIPKYFMLLYSHYFLDDAKSSDENITLCIFQNIDFPYLFPRVLNFSH